MHDPKWRSSRKGHWWILEGDHTKTLQKPGQQMTGLSTQHNEQRSKVGNPLHAETTVAEAKALHGVATMDEDKAPQRARMRFDSDGKGAAARTVDLQKTVANACCKHAQCRGGKPPLFVGETSLPIDGARTKVGA